MGLGALEETLHQNKVGIETLDRFTAGHIGKLKQNGLKHLPWEILRELGGINAVQDAHTFLRQSLGIMFDTTKTKTLPFERELGTIPPF